MATLHACSPAAPGACRVRGATGDGGGVRIGNGRGSPIELGKDSEERKSALSLKGRAGAN